MARLLLATDVMECDIKVLLWFLHPERLSQLPALILYQFSIFTI